jgi:ABC-type phosphate transport system substrate-binding protein
VVIPQTRTASNRNFAEIVMGDATFPASSVITETAGAVLEAVKGKRAISFISFGAISNKPEFKILKVDGKSPSDSGYPINQEMYFITLGEPSGNIKKYVDFFLAGPGRDFIVKAGLLPGK